MYPRNDGLGLSLLIYLAAMLCGLAVLAVPFYFAARPTVIKNANVQRFERREDRAAYSRFHFLRLKERTIVTPAELAQVDAQEQRVKEAEHKQAAPVRMAQRISPPPPPRALTRPPPPHNSLAEIGVHLGFRRFLALF